MWVKTRLWPALAELALAFCGLLAGSLVVDLGNRGLSALVGSHTAITLLLGPLVTFVAVFVYAKLGQFLVRSSGDRDDAAPPLPRASVRTTIGVVFVALAAALLGSFALGLLLDLLGLPVAEQGRVLEIAERARHGEGIAEATMLVVAALLLAPVAEELLFRDLLWQRVRTLGGPTLAYAVSMFGFAIIHGNPAGLFIYAWLGLCFAWALQRTGRVSAAIAVHMGNNAYVLVALFFGAA